MPDISESLRNVVAKGNMVTIVLILNSRMTKSDAPGARSRLPALEFLSPRLAAHCPTGSEDSSQSVRHYLPIFCPITSPETMISTRRFF